MSASLALILVAVFLPTAAGQAALAGAPHPVAATPQTTAAGGARPSGGARGPAHAFRVPGHHRAAVAAASAADSSSGDLAIRQCDAAGDPVVQHNPTFYAIFWLPSGATFEPGIINGDSNYESLMARYLKDSDQTTLANVVAQYYDCSGHHILPNYTYGGSWRDTTAYPHSGTPFDPLKDSSCTPGAPTFYTYCASTNYKNESDYQDAVNRALAANPSWQDGTNSTFFVFTGWRINSCDSDPNVGCTPGASLSPEYCAYHNYFIDANKHTAVYVNMPDDGGVGGAGCSSSAIPNGDSYADTEFTALAHEQFEVMTDPTGNGWADSSGNEIGDKCVDSSFGPNFGYAEPEWGLANQNVNGHLYVLQQLWSNADGGCFGSSYGPTGYYATYGDYVATAANSTGQINLARTALGPCCGTGTSLATVDWGDGSSVQEPGGDSGCAQICTLTGSHTYAASDTYKVTVTYWTGCCISYSTSLHIFVFDNPVPTTSSLQPNAVQAGAGDTTLTVNGSSFVAGSTVQLNGTALTTTYVSSTQLTATIPASMLATPTTADITVVNGGPGGGTSNPQTLFVPLTGAQVTASQSASGTNPQAALTGPLALSANATGAGTLTVAQYSADPGEPCCSVGVPGSSSYFDVHAAAGNSFSTVTITDCNLNGGSQVLWYDTSTATWAPASNQSYDPSTGCATVTVDSTTQPSLAQLAGLPFGVANLPPVWQPTAAQTQDYHDPLSFSLKATDVEPGDHLTLSVASGSSLPTGLSLKDNGDGTGTVAGTLQAAAGDYPVTFDVSDGVNPPVAQTVTLHVAREESSLTYKGDTSGTYGAPAQLAATLQEDQSGPALPTEPVAFTLGSGSGAQGCSPTPTTNSSGTASCTLATITQPAGSYTVATSFGGDHNYQGTTSSPTFTVAKQAAVITAAAANANPIQVSTAGGTASVTLKASVAGTLAGGTIANAVPVVYTLTPVGPGTSYSCTDSTGGGVSGGVLASSCAFSGIAVNVYQVSVSLAGSYYSATPALGVVTVYDPSLGFTTGGGTLLHNGVPANFGFNAKYLNSGQIQGHVLYVEHRGSGDVVLKSNAMGALSIVKGGDGTSLLAYIQGKATFQGGGNYAFTVTALDADGQASSSNPDQFGLQVTDPAGAPPSGLSFAPVTPSGGTIMVPHQ